MPRGEDEQQRVQLLTLLGVERGEELVFEAPGERAELPERALAVGRDADDLTAAVVGIALALDELLLLELVQQPDERAAVVAERVGDRSLRLGRALVEQRQDRVVIRAEAGLLVLVQRALLRGKTKALQQEEGGSDKLRREPRARLFLDLRINAHFRE